MSAEELLLLILGVSAAIVLFTTGMFLIFRRFLNKEDEKGRKFRSAHGGDASEPDRTL